jgi:lipopolysaccharide transport system ATP-binding protein
MRREKKEIFWALKDVSFEINQGEVVGIIGRNGAGKSTLLKILSRITEMSDGEADLYGRVGSLLEVGTGFHQELTGRENIFLNGAILGMTRSEIRQQFDAIVDFAGVDKFIDTPVKRYSSGMYVRLAFAVAAHLRSEILIVDEVLAVGDTEFQKKCLDKMRDVSTDGRTILFVSHNMHSITTLCTRVLMLDQGHLVHAGSPPSAIERYTQSLRTRRAGATNERPESARRGSGEYRYVYVQPVKEHFEPAEPKRFSYRVERRRGSLGRFYLSAHLFNESGLELAQMDGRLVGRWNQDADAVGGELVIHAPWLKPGNYRLDTTICTGSGIVDLFEGAAHFEVGSVLPYPHTASATATAQGALFADFDWKPAACVTEHTDPYEETVQSGTSFAE